MKADAAGADNGSTWADAFTDLQSALDVAGAGDEIWVAAGRYVPSRSYFPNPRCVAFALLPDVALYGGFAGVETSRDASDPRAFKTFLDGDLLGNDTAISGRSENAVHVLVALTPVGPATVLDGFVVRGGHATDSSVPGPLAGAGLFVVGGSPTIARCAFVANACARDGDLGGAAATFAGGSPLVTLCDFRGNRCVGVAPNGSSGGVVERSRFRKNVTSGVVLADATRGLVDDCRFSENRATTGGGVRVVRSRDCRVRRSRFTSLHATGGGGVALESSSNCVISEGLFERCDATGGGAVSVADSDDVAIVSCEMRRCSATTGSGVSAFLCDRLRIENVLLADGTTAPPGSPALRFFYCGDTRISNSTIARSNHGGLFVGEGSSVAVVNSIFWSNIDGDIDVDFDASLTVARSHVSLGWPGEGNVSGDPLFVSPGLGDYRLDAGSPCLETGDDASLPDDIADLDGDGDSVEPLPLDLDGLPRRVDANGDRRPPWTWARTRGRGHQVSRRLINKRIARLRPTTATTRCRENGSMWRTRSSATASSGRQQRHRLAWPKEIDP